MMTEQQGEEVGRLKAEAIELAQTLHQIVIESDDAEAVRIALSGLQGTQTGRDYLAANPLGR